MIISATQASKGCKQTIEIPIPKYHCASCTKCVNKMCTFFGRYVEINYNKCFNHSKYNWLPKYVEPTNLKEIVEKEYEEELRKLVA